MRYLRYPEPIHCKRYPTTLGGAGDVAQQVLKDRCVDFMEYLEDYLERLPLPGIKSVRKLEGFLNVLRKSSGKPGEWLAFEDAHWELVRDQLQREDALFPGGQTVAFLPFFDAVADATCNAPAELRRNGAGSDIPEAAAAAATGAAEKG